MNFVQLVNDALTECGTGQTTALTTVQTAPNAEVQRFIGWVGDAWHEIQASKPTWEFLRTTVDIPLTTQVGDYSESAIEALITANSFATWTTLSPTLPVLANAGIAMYVPKSFRCWTSALVLAPPSSTWPGGEPGDEQIMNYMQWNTFRNIYRYATMRSTYNRPVVVSTDPLKGLRFGPIPDQAYNIEFEIYQQPQILVADTDVPMIGQRYHKAITYAVMMKYGAFESASEVYQRGKEGYDMMMDPLLQDRLEIMQMGPPLA